MVPGNSLAPGRRFQTQFRTMSYTLESSVENVEGTAWEIGLNVQVTKEGDDEKERSLGGEGSFARSLQDGKATD